MAVGTVSFRQIIVPWPLVFSPRPKATGTLVRFSSASAGSMHRVGSLLNSSIRQEISCGFSHLLIPIRHGSPQGVEVSTVRQNFQHINAKVWIGILQTSS